MGEEYLKKNKILKVGLYIALLFTLFLTGCSNSNSKNDSTRNLKDSMGHEVTVPTHPKRVVGSYLEDYLVAVGVKPVVQWSVKNASSTQEYLKKDLKNVPTIDYSLPYEAVTKAKPDLILMGTDSQVQNGKYNQYKKIAPTYVVKNGTDVSWRDQFLDVAKAVNKTDKANDVLKTYDQKLKSARNTLDKKAANKSVAVVWVTNNSAFIVSDKSSSGSLLYGDLKLKEPSLVKEVSKKATADWSSVSLEKLAKLDADYIFLVNSDKGADMFKDPIWTNIKAVKDGNLFQYGNDSSWQYKGPIAYTQMIDNVLKDMTK
ncbi:ferrichrome ABC transporter substrate-binding protein [Lactobacillus salsicarnum]|uniref:Ferrichrome ABC transporter substrate-binding protein n=1 Tax=Companilactobacillus mishanensis TaxID=2486008 RepID=A0A5P0ZKG0_9LACO|nr:ABC transporter substrate-binding protein [Companilactobacillus mishanensis]MQS45267.1 ferrichrome ABC transporter substrate-binding protein [Companilactobacillus mishanensis]MQS53590.1 ferrichrome ABC transporter substrate-binding protein [Companilactobacillus mishanensis]